MSKKKFALSEATVGDIMDLHTILTGELQDLQDEYDNKSADWQISDEGTEIGAWLEELGNLTDDLEKLINSDK